MCGKSLDRLRHHSVGMVHYIPGTRFPKRNVTKEEKGILAISDSLLAFAA